MEERRTCLQRSWSCRSPRKEDGPLVAVSAPSSSLPQPPSTNTLSNSETIRFSETYRNQIERGDSFKMIHCNWKETFGCSNVNYSPITDTELNKYVSCKRDLVLSFVFVIAPLKKQNCFTFI